MFFAFVLCGGLIRSIRPWLDMYLALVSAAITGRILNTYDNVYLSSKDKKHGCEWLVWSMEL